MTPFLEWFKWAYWVIIFIYLECLRRRFFGRNAVHDRLSSIAARG